MALPLDKPVESPFKTKGSLGRALVDGNDQDISNINHYLALLAQTANQKEKLRRKKRRERRERKRLSSGGKDRKKSRRHRSRHDKGKEVSPDTPQPESDKALKPDTKDQTTHGDVSSQTAGIALEHRGGRLVAPTLPTHPSRPAMGNRHMSCPSDMESASLAVLNDRSPLSLSSPPSMDLASPSAPHPATPAPLNSGFTQPRSSSWSQFVIDQSQGDMAVHNGAFTRSYRHLPHHQGRIRSFSQPGVMMMGSSQQSPSSALDPAAAEFLQMMTEHQSCSNPSFTFSSSFSSDSFSAIPEEPFFGGFIPSATPVYPSPPLPHHHHQLHSPSGSGPIGLPPSAFLAADPLPPTLCSDPQLVGILSPSASSFMLDPVDDRDGTYASLEFLEAALAHDIMNGGQ